MQLIVLFTLLLLLLAALLLCTASKRCLCVTLLTSDRCSRLVSPFISFRPSAQTEETATEYKSVLDHREVKADSSLSRVFLDHL